MSSLVRSLREQGLPLEDQLISYYNQREDIFIFAGKLPIISEDRIPEIAFISKNRLLIRLRTNIDNNRNSSNV